MDPASNIGLLTAAGAGLVSFLSPCVLPLVPGYLSYIAGRSVVDPDEPRDARFRLTVVVLAFAFVLGFSTVFVLLGASATAAGQLLLAYREQLTLVGGAIVALFGIVTLGLIKPVWLLRDLRLTLPVVGGRPESAYLLGLAFAFGWTPCIGPILGAILTVGATSATVSGGVTLLGFYSLGLGVPFLISALLVERIVYWLRSARRAGMVLQLAAGGVMVAIGLAMLTGQLSVLSYWFLDAVPLLGEIG
ncbi:MAG TPA: cytochrome c biogenesis protein CcdA [Alphaproteobacteria bacterium]